MSNTSIRDNIIGFGQYDAKRYMEAVDATMLTADLNTLPQGDSTIVGSNGISLSGGQRQRIALARALYAESNIAIFDDIFSGLDATTEQQVFRRVFGPNGLLRRRNVTAVLCTHSVRHLPYAQHIVVLGPNGRIAEQGTFDELMTNASYVQGLGVKTMTTSDSEFLAQEDQSAPTFHSPSQQTVMSSTEAPDAGVAAMKRQLGDSSVYRHYFKSMGFLLAGCIFAWGASFGFFYNFPTIWLKYWSDDVASGKPAHPLGYWVGMYALFEICCLLSLIGLGQFIWVMSIKKSGAHLHQAILHTLVRAPLRFLTMTDQGTITNLFSQDLNLIDTELPNALLNTLYNSFVAIGQAAVMATSSPYIAISYPFLMALMWVLQRFYLRTSRQLRILDLEAKSPL